ncbi:hypothetical protein [Pontibacillus marinus]|uniref:Uncharacterized protein n=1 Tax=Pontibacillus marinus BH030004 = DSM 16465 TaxID=1385511 RepID=A0A0A5G429_9BACI|nr:hypothetical protein [Pontibacillus marinus]KGX86809.1 hypothetical protein N783_11605 [Pontibacillus marinus BH030004 = DSM 16465]
MRTNNYFAALVFFTILGIVTSTVLNSVILTQVAAIKDKLQNQGGDGRSRQ